MNYRRTGSEGSEEWYAVQTKPLCESRVGSCLKAFALEVLLPRVKCRRSRNRVSKKAFFPGYLFTRVSVGTAEMNLVQYCPGVVRVVNSRGTPVPVEDEIIGSIQALMDDDGFIELKIDPLKEGARIRIDEGHLQGWSGEMERELDGGKRVAILLDTILHARVIVERCQVSVSTES